MTTHRRRAALVNLIFNYSSVVTSVLKNILLVPVYLQHFDVATYGAWLATGNVLGMLGVVDGGFGLVLNQRLASTWGADDRRRFCATTGVAIGWSLAAALILFTAGASLASYLPGWLHAPAGGHGRLTLAVRLAACGAALTMVQANVLGVSYAWQESVVAGMCRLAAQVVEILLTVSALYAGFGVASLGLGLCGGGTVGLLMAVGETARRWIRADLDWPAFDLAEGRELLTLVVPNALGKMGSVIIGNSEAAIAAVMIDTRASAVLVLTGRVFKFAESLVNPIAGSTFYGLAHMSGNTPVVRLRAVVREVISVSTGLAVMMLPVALVLCGPFVRLWVGADNFGGLPLAAILVVNSLLVVRVNLLGMILPAVGEIRSIAWCPPVEAALRLLLTLVFVPALGLFGMPLAAIVSTAGVSLGYYAYRLERRLSDDRGTGGLQSVGLAATLILLCCAIGGAMLVTPQVDTWSEFGWLAALSMVFLPPLAMVCSPGARDALRRAVLEPFSATRRVISDVA